MKLPSNDWEELGPADWEDVTDQHVTSGGGSQLATGGDQEMPMAGGPGPTALAQAGHVINSVANTVPNQVDTVKAAVGGLLTALPHMVPGSAPFQEAAKPIAPIAQGIYNTIKATTTPENAVVGGLAAALPPPLDLIPAAYYGYQMAKGTHEQYKQSLKAAEYAGETGDYDPLKQSLTETVGSGTLAYMGGRHVVKQAPGVALDTIARTYPAYENWKAKSQAAFERAHPPREPYSQTIYRGESASTPVDAGWSGSGEYWTPDMKEAGRYAKPDFNKPYSGTGSVYEAEASLRNPYISKGAFNDPLISEIVQRVNEEDGLVNNPMARSDRASAEIRKELERRGHDGIISGSGKYKEVVVFNPKESISGKRSVPFDVDNQGEVIPRGPDWQEIDPNSPLAQQTLDHGVPQDVQEPPFQKTRPKQLTSGNLIPSGDDLYGIPTDYLLDALHGDAITPQDRALRLRYQRELDKRNPDEVAALRGPVEQYRKDSGSTLGEDATGLVDEFTQRRHQKLMDQWHQQTREEIVAGKYDDIGEAPIDQASMGEKLDVTQGQQDRANLLQHQRDRIQDVTGNRFNEDERGFVNFWQPRPEGEPSLGATMRSKFGDYGLARLQEQYPELANLAAQVAGSRSEANVFLRRVVPTLAEKLGGVDKVQPFFEALLENQRRGSKQHYTSLADEIANLSPEDLAKKYGEGAPGDLPYEEIVKAVSKDMRNRVTDPDQKDVWVKLPNLLRNKINVYNDLQSGQSARFKTMNLTDRQLRAQQEIESVRRIMGHAFNEAGRTVESVKPDFDQYTQTPEFQAALPVYKDLIEKPLENARLAAGAPMLRERGPLDTYFPDIGKAKRPQGRISNRAMLEEAYDPFSEFRTGLGAGHNVSPESLRGATSYSMYASSLNTFLRALEASPLSEELSNTASVPEGWREVPSSKTLNIEQNGEKVAQRVGKKRVIPDWVYQEVEPIIKQMDNPFNPQNPKTLMHRITQASLIGPLDAVFHYSNILSGLVTNVPVLGRGVIGKTLGMMPPTKWAVAVARAMAEDVNSPAAIEKIEYMARNGMIQSRYGSATYSGDISKLTGAEHVRLVPYKNAEGRFVNPNLGPMLYGPKGIDIRARLIMLEAVKTMKPNASVGEVRDFVNRLGNYQYQLESRLSRGLKRTGIAPFYTAGSTMIRNGFAAWGLAGRVPMEPGAKALAYETARQLSGGAAGLLVTWAVAYKAYHDKWPWGDPNSRLFQIPLKPEHTSDLLYGKESRKNRGPGYVNLGFLNPAALRGPGAMVKNAYETGMAGGTKGQGVEQAYRGGLNAVTHPVAGPGVTAAMAATLGVKPYVQSTMENGKLGSKFMPVEGGKIPPGAAIPERLRAAAVGSLQPLAMARDVQDREDRTIGRALLDLAAPRLIGGRYDARKTRKRLRTEQRATRNAEWEFVGLGN